MTHGLDTSVVVRIISGLPEGAARRVGERIAAEVASGELFSVSPLVLSEAYFALQHHYNFTKDEALQSLRALVMVQGQLMDVKQLRENAKKFIKNEENADFYPKLVEEDFGAPIGIVKYTKDHVISVQNDVDTQYQAYLDVQNELVAAYNELREECAQKYFHKAYNELDEDQQKQIQKIYPQKISEAEPKNYGN